MPNQHVATTEVNQHGSGDFCCKGAGSMLTQRLSPPSYRRTRQRRLRLSQVWIRRANRHFACQTAHSLLDALKKSRILRKAPVHLPVTSNELSAHRSEDLIGEKPLDYSDLAFFRSIRTESSLIYWTHSLTTAANFSAAAT